MVQCYHVNNFQWQRMQLYNYTHLYKLYIIVFCLETFTNSLVLMKYQTALTTCNVSFLFYKPLMQNTNCIALTPSDTKFFSQAFIIIVNTSTLLFIGKIKN